MESPHCLGALRLAVVFLTLVPSLVTAQYCQPYRWSSSGLEKRQDGPADPGLAIDCSNVQPKTDYCVRRCKYKNLILPHKGQS
jgi:hypothetical protein